MFARLVDGGFWLALYPWHNPRATLLLAWNGIFRIATLVSVGYLVLDRAYETDGFCSCINQ